MSEFIKKNSVLKVKDHSVSGEIFELIKNEESGILETFPRPIEQNLPAYYKSEDYISHTDSKRTILEQAYHLVKGIALKRKLKLVNRVASSSKVLLDVGCGTGDFLKVAALAGWTVTGIEPNEQARHLGNAKTNNKVYDTPKLNALEPASFDVITLWHVLEHLPNIEQQVATLKSLLKKDGVLIIAVPNYNSYDALLYKEYWAAYDVPRHLWHFSQQAISKLSERAGMTVIEKIPMMFDAYYVSLLSEKYKSGSIKYFKGFWSGLRSNWSARATGEYSSIIYVIKRGERSL